MKDIEPLYITIPIATYEDLIGRATTLSTVKKLIQSSEYKTIDFVRLILEVDANEE